MKQYLELCQRIVDEGIWVENKRTGTRCLTVINAELEYDVANNRFPMITTRKSYYKAAIAELLGYLRGYSSAAQFREIGCMTWNANANENQAWLNNPHRKGEDDMGRVYGVQGRAWQKPDGTPLDQLKKVIDNLKSGVDDRGEIITFYNKLPLNTLLVSEWVSGMTHRLKTLIEILTGRLYQFTLLQNTRG